MVLFIPVLSYSFSDISMFPAPKQSGGWYLFSWESKKAAKPVTAVQDCVTTFVSVKPLDSF